MTPIDGPRDPIGPGHRLVDRIGALVDPVKTHRLKWRWMLDWWDRVSAHGLRTRTRRRRGVPVS